MWRNRLEIDYKREVEKEKFSNLVEEINIT